MVATAAEEGGNGNRMPAIREDIGVEATSGGEDDSAAAPHREGQGTKESSMGSKASDGSPPRISMAVMEDKAPQEETTAPPPPADKKTGQKKFTEPTGQATGAAKTRGGKGGGLVFSLPQPWPKIRRAAAMAALEPPDHTAAAAAK